jgi:hypothetical protein
MQLYKEHPDMRFIIQDRPRVIDEAQEIWGTDYPEALKGGRVKLMAHDFFEPNPIKNAEVYCLRHILYV